MVYLPFVLRGCGVDGKLVDFIQCLEIASIFSVFAIWFCIYILAFVLCTVWLVVFRKSMSIFEIEIASIRKFEIERASTFSLFAIWFCIYIWLSSLYGMAGCIQNHRKDGRTELSSTD